MIIDNIYCISDGQFLKIGYSYKPLERLQLFQMGNPRKLSLVYSKPPRILLTAKDVESAVHKRLRKFHLRGEWFDVPLEMAIATIQEVSRDLLMKGAGNYGGELYENNEDDGFGDWED